MGLKVLVYRRTQNLGDAIQAIALSRWLGPCSGVYRDALWQGYRDLVVCGYLNCGMILHPTTILTGVHVEKDITLPPVAKLGVRDPVTQARVGGELTGCVTLTLPHHYSKKRSGRIAVDCPENGFESRTHLIESDMPWDEQWRRGMDALISYAKATLVYTTRLHAALPCLALGTPVLLKAPTNENAADRFSLWSKLGLPFDEVVTKDVTEWRETWVDFLGIGKERFPVMPVPYEDCGSL